MNKMYVYLKWPFWAKMYKFLDHINNQLYGVLHMYAGAIMLITVTIIDNIIIIIITTQNHKYEPLLPNDFNLLVCPDNKFECQHGCVDGQQPPCICAEDRCDNVTDCVGGEDELEHNCPCGPEGAVRLVDGIVPYQGRVEYCRIGRWASICSYYSYRWGSREAAVVCRQLGYPSAGSLQFFCIFILLTHILHIYKQRKQAYI